MVAELRRLIADHPLREGLWALLMRALYGSGRQAEALEAFAQAREVIADELGVEPSAELRQLHQQLLQADAGSGSLSATKTAAADSPFAGTPVSPAGPVPAGRAARAAGGTRTAGPVTGFAPSSDPVPVPRSAQLPGGHPRLHRPGGPCAEAA